MSYFIKVILILCTILLSHNLYAKASFNCSKASTKIEKTICTNENLSILDGEMGVLYKKLSVSMHGVQLDIFKKHQLNWLSEERNTSNVSSLQKLYKERINIFKKKYDNLCLRPHDMETNIHSVEQQRKVLYSYSSAWNEYVNCETKRLTLINNIHDLYDETMAELESNSGFMFAFESWSTSLLSERALYRESSHRAHIELKRKFFLLRELLKFNVYNSFSIATKSTQLKWEKYVESALDIKSIYRYNDKIYDHPRFQSENLFNLIQMLDSRIKTIYNTGCNGSQIMRCDIIAK